MASKSGSGKRYGSTSSRNAREKERTIAELKDRVAALENGIRPIHENAAFHDDTDVKQDADIFRDGVELFRATFEQAAVGIANVALDGRWLRFNQKLCDILGYSREELFGMTFQDIVYPNDLEVDLKNVERLITGEISTYSMEKRYVKKDGSIVHANLTVSLLFKNGKPEHFISVIQDISDRKQAEKDLRLKQFSIDRAADMVLWVAPDARFIDVNEAACRAFGYTREEFLSLKVFDTNPYFNEGNWGEHWKEIRERGSYTLEAMLRKKDDTFFPAEITVNYLVYAGKEYNCSFIRDITERKRAEEAMRFTQFAVDKAGEEVFWIAKDGCFHYVNEAACHALGYTRDELQNLKVSDIDPRVTEDNWPRFWERTNALGTSTFETVHRTKDGKNYPVEITSNHIQYNLKEYHCVFARDITERKWAEEALQESEEKFKTIFNRAALGLAISDSAGVIIDCNSAYQEILGYNKEELRTKNFLDLTHADDITKNRDLQQQMNDGLLDTYQLEKRYIHKEGTVVLCKLTSSAIRNRDGSLKYNLAIVEDITERKRMEEELKAAKQQSELYLDLMGHDINNMNQIALGYLELAQNTLNYEGYLNRQHSMLISKPADTLRNASTLISNVRKLQREKTGHYSLSNIDIDSLLRDIISQYSSVPNRDVTINFEPCGECIVKANELLRDVFTNLVGNAIKHSDDIEKLLISIRVEKVAENGTDYCKVSVEDNGHGIPDKVKTTLFDRLSLDSTRARGKGFGLCLIKLLVDDYNGEFWVEDRIKEDHTKGAKFVVMLPDVNQ